MGTALIIALLQLVVVRGGGVWTFASIEKSEEDYLIWTMTNIFPEIQ